jgi:hypothetical protein
MTYKGFVSEIPSSIEDIRNDDDGLRAIRQVGLTNY